MTNFINKPHRALFLDRDGVINIDKNYVHKISDFEFVDGIFELCRAAIVEKMLLVIVTNQSGIGRGLYSENQFYHLTEWVNKIFLAKGILISAVYFCPDHPIHGLGKYRKESYDRKPNPGMLLRARDELNIDLTQSILIGDKETDIKAANRAGVGMTVFLGKDKQGSNAKLSVTNLHHVRCLLFGL